MLSFGSSSPDYNLTKRLIFEIPLTVLSLVGSLGLMNPVGAPEIENKIASGVPSQIILEQEVEMPETSEIRKINLDGSPSVENEVRAYFKDTPQLIKIAKCESTFRQFDKNGDVVRGRVNSADVGVMQINEYYHLETAKKLGIDIYTLEGNMAYAKYLYDKEGSQPWISSSPCWSK